MIEAVINCRMCQETGQGTRQVPYAVKASTPFTLEIEPELGRPVRIQGMIWHLPVMTKLIYDAGKRHTTPGYHRIERVGGVEKEITI